MDYWQEYEEKAKKVKDANTRYLELFRSDLQAEGLAKKTIKRHMDNADCFLNAYLLWREPLTLTEGVNAMYGFVGDFCIRVHIPSSPDYVRNMAGTMRKFCKCMYKHGELDEVTCELAIEEIKECLPEWLEMARRR